LVLIRMSFCPSGPPAGMAVDATSRTHDETVSSR
jgi:hypothetical protein